MKRKVCVLITAVMVVLVLAVTFGMACGNGSAKCQKKKCYLFSYFKESGVSGMYLAYSYDGLKWRELNGGKAIIKPEIGGAFEVYGGDSIVIRDPQILRGPDGTFHMVFSAHVKPLGFGYTNSKDLINWSGQKAVWVMANEPNAINCWAPELFYDDTEKEFLLFWSSTVPGKFPETDGQSNQGPPAKGKNHRIYYCTTKDFETFSESRLFYNDGFNVIDATIVKDKNRFIMFLKDETNLPFVPQKNIRMAFSSKPQGPYSSATKPITGDYWCEGPSAIKIAGNWYVYFDKYRKDAYGVVTSKDLKNFQDISQRAVFPEGCNHGTIFEIPKNILDKLLEL